MSDRDRVGKSQVLLMPAAIEDLEAIIEYIELDDPGAAANVLTAIRSKCQSLEFMPLRGSIVPELAKAHCKGYRQLIETPWRIVYRVEGRLVLVFAVLDGRRDLDEELLERLKSPGQGIRRPEYGWHDTETVKGP